MSLRLEEQQTIVFKLMNHFSEPKRLVLTVVSQKDSGCPIISVEPEKIDLLS